jgi:hypothetical protein
MLSAVLATGIKNAKQLPHFAQALPAFKAVTMDGNTRMGRFKDEPTVAEVLERIIAEAKEAQQKLSAKLSCDPEIKEYKRRK